MAQYLLHSAAHDMMVSSWGCGFMKYTLRSCFLHSLLTQPTASKGMGHIGSSVCNYSIIQTIKNWKTTSGWVELVEEEFCSWGSLPQCIIQSAGLLESGYEAKCRASIVISVASFQGHISSSSNVARQLTECNSEKLRTRPRNETNSE